MPSDKLTKDNLWMYIKSLAAEFRKRNRNAPFTELIIVGGGSILLNYGFRDMTTDIDAFSTADEAVKDAAAAVASKMNISPEWINNDFLETNSFSSKLREVSKRYALLNNGTFDIRTVRSEYLIAMKLNSNREYKNDFSDVIGILMDEKAAGNNISPETIFEAYRFLYSSKNPLPMELQDRVRSVCFMTAEELRSLYDSKRIDEQSVRTDLLQFDEKYPNVLKQANVKDIISMLKNRRNGTARMETAFGTVSQPFHNNNSDDNAGKHTSGNISETLSNKEAPDMFYPEKQDEDKTQP